MQLQRTAALAALLLLPVAGCANPQANPAVSPATAPRLVVKNRSAFDMDIYLNSRGQRIRLGIASADTTTQFSLPQDQVVGAGLVTFQAVPITGGGESSSTEPTNVPPGGEITLDIPPP